jgi:hypothetical protein
MDIPGFISPLISKFLDSILSSDASKELKQKRELGRILVRISAIIDAYIFQCTWLRRELDAFTAQDGKEKFRMIAARFSSLRRLADEFASTVGEVIYLKLFDSELEERLVAGALAEFGYIWPGTYAALIDDAFHVAKSCLKGHILRLFVGPPQVGRTASLDLIQAKDRATLDEYLVATIATLEQAHCRLSEFIAEHFEIWEVFHARNEYGKQAKA